MAEKSTISFVTTLVPFLVLRTQSRLSVAFGIVSGLLERLVQWHAAYLSGWMVPDVVTLSGVFHVISVVSLHFNWPQWGEEVLGENFKLQLQIGSLIPAVDTVGFLAPLLVLSVHFHFIFFAHGIPRWMEVQ
jgi:hypothetical protein